MYMYQCFPQAKRKKGGGGGGGREGEVAQNVKLYLEAWCMYILYA